MTTETSKFGILGYGYIGKATHYGLLKNQKCIIYDNIFNSKKSILKYADTIFICIPTINDDDIKKIIDEILYLKQLNSDVQIIIRSTLPIGSSKTIQQKTGNIIYIPEFLRERYWDTDCLKRPLIVGHDSNVNLPLWLEKEEIIKCSLNEAELVKMFSNNFAVIRIAFANIFYDLSLKMNADYSHIKNMYFKIQHDQTYMEVPGHDGTRGFGGKCLPKDLDFLISTLDKYEINQNWFTHIRELNREWKKKF